jgi:hypothetical protein
MSHYFVDGTEICAICWSRGGLHKYGNESCPNPAWLAAPGNGRAQWLKSSFSRAHVQEPDAWGHQESSTLQELYTVRTA